MTDATTSAPTRPAPAAAWHSHHVFLHTTAEDLDAFLTGVLGPRLDGLVHGREGAGWFFIRYGEGGPHLRVRVRGLAADQLAALPADLARLAAEQPATAELPPAAGETTTAVPRPSRHGEVRAVPYVPETDRYGGPLVLPVAEDVFTASTRVALRALRELPSGSARLATAADLAHGTAYALGLDELAAAQWLRRHAAGWRWTDEVPLLPADAVHARVNSVFAAQRSALATRASAVREGVQRRTAAPWLIEWADAVRAADAAMRAATGRDLSDLRVWGSQLHMLFNRLGVTPDEERAVCRLAARTLLETGEPPSFFPEGHCAADRQYLERSKFQIGRMADSAVRPITEAPGSAPATGTAARSEPPLPEVELVAGPRPDVTLHAALTGRSSARGPLTGPLTTADLGTLLWDSCAETHHSQQPLPAGGVRELRHRPYPSAGALYSVRLRLAALAVDGLPAATYECVPARRALWRIGPPPAVADVTALSSYFSRSSDDPDWIGVAGLPLLIGVYLDLGLLRRRYGLRALRMGLLEAGHLTQTLLLNATALGLASTTLGGFHDDLAHELLGLDDIEHPLQYLLPVGRRQRNREHRG